MSYSPVQTQPDQVPTQIEQLQVREGKERNDLEDEDEDDEHFGDGGVRPGNELGIGELEDALPPNVKEELAAIGDVKCLEPGIQALTSSGMKCPIEIPQRRPASKTRGFIRAYAAVLPEYDIDQDTSLIFRP